jgi:molybdenum cofactor synthesis domain-containing protein
MRPLQRLIPFDEARARWMATCTPTQRQETVAFEDADGRTLAADVKAPIDVPGFDRSAMDGFAVASQDTSGAGVATPVRLRLVGTIHAGAPTALKIKAGECAQIATGGALPEGADAVVMVEQTRFVDAQVEVLRPVRAKENVGAKGGDLRAGETALARGLRLNPARIAVLAALGLKTATVHDRPRVAIVSTGSELRTPGQNLKPGLIYDSNSPALSALLRRHGSRVEHAGIVPDDPELLRKTLLRLTHADLILVTGSSSAGERDHLVPLMGEIGTVEFHGVDVKPGKPLLLGRLGAVPVLGLAGNPASCLLMCEVLVVPWLRRFQHQPRRPPTTVLARWAHPVTSPKGKRHFLPVRLRDGRAESVYKESDSTTSLSRADGYVEIKEQTESIDEGAEAEIHLFE